MLGLHKMAGAWPVQRLIFITTDQREPHGMDNHVALTRLELSTPQTKKSQNIFELHISNFFLIEESTGLEERKLHTSPWWLVMQRPCLERSRCTTLTRGHLGHDEERGHSDRMHECRSRAARCLEPMVDHKGAADSLEPWRLCRPIRCKSVFKQ